MRTTAALGSLAAIAGLVAAQKASAQLTLSSLSNIALSDYTDDWLDIDIDQDNVSDFNIFVSSGSGFGNDLNPRHIGNLMLVDGSSSPDLASLSLGDLINGTSNFNDYAQFTNFSAGGTQYVGVTFDINGENHYGWLEFNFPTTDFLDGTLVSAGWNATANTTAQISNLSAVPEPATTGLVGGALAGLVGFWRRRKRSSVTG